MTGTTRSLLDQHFDTAFAAPGGIAKLRELILTLAMQGKLVEQDSDDPPASELLKEIEAEKQRLVKAGKIKQLKPLAPIKPEEIPYKLPQGWEWVRLGDIGIWKSGSTPSRSNASFYGGDIPWVKSGEVKQGRIITTEETITQAALDKCSLHINEKGTVLVAMYGANIGEVGILEIEAATNQAVCACKTFTNFNEEYLLYLITSLKPYFISMGAGAAQPNISREKIVVTTFPLPPLPEQHRIVSRVDQLMALCDELENFRNEREQKRLAVHAAAIKHLLDTPDGSARDFLQQHFGELYTVRENVAELRKAILQLAVMGRLVPQDPNDPPASLLLKEIEAEKQRLLKAGKFKQPKPLPPIKLEEAFCELPQGWECVRLGDLSPEYQNGIAKRDSDEGQDTIVLRLADIVGNEISLRDTRSIPLTNKEHEKYLLCDGDILITRVNGSVDLVGSFIRVRQIHQPIAYCDHFIRMKLPSQFVDVDYLHLIAKGTLIRRQIESKFVTTAGQKTVNQTHISTLALPLPPLPEQHRIVTKINRLMVLCDSLDQQIDAATVKQSELLDAVMAQE